MQSPEPIFNVPKVVAAALGLIIAVHVLRLLVSPDLDLWIVSVAAFIPARFDSYGYELPGGEIARFTSWITHMFVHGDFVHLAFNAAWLLVFGGAIADRAGAARFVVFSLLTGMAGAAAFLIWNPGMLAAVIGASGAVSGLMGGTMRFMFGAIDSGGLRTLRDAPGAAPLMGLKAALSDRRVQMVTIATVIINVLAAFGFGSAQDAGGIAWEAHLGGYFTGFLMYGWFDRSEPVEHLQQPNDS